MPTIADPYTYDGPWGMHMSNEQRAIVIVMIPRSTSRHNILFSCIVSFRCFASDRFIFMCGVCATAKNNNNNNNNGHWASIWLPHVRRATIQIIFKVSSGACALRIQFSCILDMDAVVVVAVTVGNSVYDFATNCRKTATAAAAHDQIYCTFTEQRIYSNSCTHMAHDASYTTHCMMIACVIEHVCTLYPLRVQHCRMPMAQCNGCLSTCVYCKRVHINIV